MVIIGLVVISILVAIVVIIRLSVGTIPKGRVWFLATVSVGILSGIFAFAWGTFSNPFKKYGVAFVVDYPGTNDRYTTYTPVLASNPKIVLGPTVGADYAGLTFKDLDQDGVKEAVIATRFPGFYKFFEVSGVYPSRHELTFCFNEQTQRPEFKFLRSVKI